MRDCHIKVLGETQAQLAANLASELGVAYVRYGSNINKLAPHGAVYTFSGKEEIVFSDEDAHNESNGHWRGTVTCTLTAYFRNPRGSEVARGELPGDLTSF
ncbi:hypothetical protein G6011_06927 [Alternaria panax]|uniref:Uncharacterized protein n=1 Tax=Alternaria panax TaxID=48097 RepID=A0AAD4FA32_9PLEO|nr:hypothetical protein G6011_06927 [Alternaria panax]